MTREEAIETLKANYPDACYEQLREAVDTAIEALKAQDTAGDTIYRQAAIIQLSHNKKMGDDEWELAVENDIQTIWKLPPAQQEPLKITIDHILI